MFESFFDNFSKVVQYIINIIVDILNHAISLLGDIVNWFKNKYKGLRRYAIYVFTARSFTDLIGKNVDNVPGLKDALGRAKPFHVPGLFDEEKFSEGVVETVLDTVTGEITDLRMIAGQGIDQDLKDAMQGTESLKLT